MTRNMARIGLIVLVIAAFLAVAMYVVACGGKTTVTTAGNSTASSSAGSTGTTSGSTTDSTIVQGGKTLAQYQSEIPGLEKAVQTDPTDFTSWESLAVANYQLKNYQAAADDYNKIIAATNDAFTINNLGNVYRDWGKNDEAIAAYKKAIAADPTLKQPYINLAGVYKNSGDLASAIKVLDQAKAALNGDAKSTVEKYQQQLESTTTTK